LHDWTFIIIICRKLSLTIVPDFIEFFFKQVVVNLRKPSFANNLELSQQIVYLCSANGKHISLPHSDTPLAATLIVRKATCLLKTKLENNQKSVRPPGGTRTLKTQGWQLQLVLNTRKTTQLNKLENSNSRRQLLTEMLDYRMGVIAHDEGEQQALS
jgi:hypothetical protein